MQTVINRCLNRNGCSLSERNCNYRLFKRNCIRSCNVNSTLTDNLSVVNHLRCYSAFGSVGGEHTVFDGSHAFFLDRPCNIIRNIYLSTNGIGSKCIKSYSTAGSIVVIVRTYGCLSKLTIIGSSRDYQEGIRGRSFAAVCQRAVDLQIFTGALRYEGCRSTAITVCCIDAAHLDHVIGHFIHGETS